MASPSRIVLVGGGHAHAQVIKAFTKVAMPDFSVTLIDPDSAPSYSGMVPGCVSTLYTQEQTKVILFSYYTKQAFLSSFRLPVLSSACLPALPVLYPSFLLSILLLLPSFCPWNVSPSPSPQDPACSTGQVGWHHAHSSSSRRH